MSRTKSRNPQQLKDVLMFLVLIFNYLTKFVAPIRRNILYLKYVQFLKTNSNKESAVLTFIDFAFFSAENLFFSSFDQTCGNNTQHYMASQASLLLLYWNVAPASSRTQLLLSSAASMHSGYTLHYGPNSSENNWSVLLNLRVYIFLFFFIL